MSSGADLFIVCKHCGSEVSPYVTECPYCGKRLRRRAPKLPKEHGGGGHGGSPPVRGTIERLARKRSAGVAVGTRPYATIALVLCACGVWVVTGSGFVAEGKLMVLGSLNGEWWRLVTYPFTYDSGVYAFVALLAVGVFGWLLERRHGPVMVVALFLGASVAGALVADALFSEPVLTGGNAGALALVAAWAMPDVRLARRGELYDGDLLGAAAIAAALLAMPLARVDVNWLAGVVGGAVGVAVGIGIAQMDGAAEL